MAAILLLVEVGFLITNAASYHISSGMLLLLMVAEVGTLLIVIFEGIAMHICAIPSFIAFSPCGFQSGQTLYTAGNKSPAAVAELL
ncbi:MAG: hypothetical protein PUE58_02870 [Lachnospiraceae bacterium]|nr:hypothetical protein [Lachnospiraceae bacterium]